MIMRRKKKPDYSKYVLYMIMYIDTYIGLR